MTRAAIELDPSASERLAARVIRLADAVGAPDVPTMTDVPGLSFVRARAPTRHEPMVYQPLVCVVLQGAEETMLGERTVTFAAGQSLIVSLDLPALSRIREASAAAPYVALALVLDPDLLRDLDAALGPDPEGPSPNGPADAAIAVGRADDLLIDAMRRLFDLVARPDERPVMLPLLRREVHYRLLCAVHAGMLRRLARRHGHAARIARAVATLRRGYAGPLGVGDLARDAHMSVSTFHGHFKAVTGTTPLQYQKSLRLLDARARLRRGPSVTSVAFAVGYRSAQQFSRDYARHFGRPPVRDRGPAAPAAT